MTMSAAFETTWQPHGGTIRRLAAVLTVMGCVAQTGEVGGNEDGRTLVAHPVIDHVGALAREPMIVELGEALFVSGYGEERPLLWRSDDGGETWQSVTVGFLSDGAIGNSDVDLAVAPDGTLHFVVMSFDRQAFEGTGIAIGSSIDDGATWKWASLSNDRFDDRPWVEVAPDGTAHVIWNDGAGISHAVSTDRGQSWRELTRIDTIGGSSHLAVGPNGEIAVRITPLSASSNRFDPGIDHLAVSIDGGASWTTRELPGTREWNASFDPSQGVIRWVEPIAWDSMGALYSLWSEGRTLLLGRSEDDGARWTSWEIVQDSASLYFPYLVAHGNGELAATWFSGFGESLRANVAHIQMHESGVSPPRVTRSEPYMFPAFRTADGGARIRDTAGEYFPATFLRDGRLAVVSTIQDDAAQRLGFTFRTYSLKER